MKKLDIASLRALAAAGGTYVTIAVDDPDALMVDLVADGGVVEMSPRDVHQVEGGRLITWRLGTVLLDGMVVSVSSLNRRVVELGAGKAA